MHTIADPLVLVQNERLFRDRVAQRRSSGNLAQVYIAAPRQFDEKAGAPYGAGHCVFSPESYVGLVDVLDSWARNGIYPGSGALEAAIGVKNGLNLAYQPPEWPAGPRP